MTTLFLSTGTNFVILVLAISLISIAATAALAFNITDTILRTNVEQTMSDEAQERGSTISSIVKQRVDSVESFATNSIIIDLLFSIYGSNADFQSEPRLEKDRKNLENQVRLFQQDEFTAGIKDLKIYNSMGIPIFSLDGEHVTKSLSDSERDTVKTDVRFIQDDNSEKRLLRISVPIMSDELGMSVGKIIITTHTAVIDDVLFNRFGLDETGEVYLVNQDQLMISESIFAKNAAFKQKVETAPVIMCFEHGQSVSGMIYADYRKVDIFGISHCENNLGFVLLTEVDKDIIIKPIHELQEKIIILGASMMAIASVATFVLSRRISNP